MTKFSPIVLAVVAIMASSASAFVPSNQMGSLSTVARVSEKMPTIESVLNMSEQNVGSIFEVLSLQYFDGLNFLTLPFF